jgi:hypothetical protein
MGSGLHDLIFKHTKSNMQYEIYFIRFYSNIFLKSLNNRISKNKELKNNKLIN